MSLDSLTEGMKWKDVVQLIGIGIIIGGGWYKLGEIERNVGTFTGKHETLSSRVSINENVLLERKAEIAKVGILQQDVTRNRDRLSILESDSRDWIKRSTIERWAVQLEKVNAMKLLEVPSIPE